MANPFKGEVRIEDGERQYKFVFGMYAQIRLEELVGESWAAFWARAKEWSATDIVHLFVAGLARHQENMTKRDVADLMDRLGPERCSEIVNQAVRLAMPEEKSPEADVGGEGAKGDDRPPQQRKRTVQAITT